MDKNSIFFYLSKIHRENIILMNEILGDKDRIRIEDGAIITIGATTIILRSAREREEI